MEIFYVITMVAKTGIRLYLACTEYDSAMKWVTDVDEACWFNTSSEADKFAKNYFVSFKNYQITAVGCNMEEVA